MLVRCGQICGAEVPTTTTTVTLMASIDLFQGCTKAMAPLRTLSAALNSDRSSSSGKSASGDLDLDTQLFMENILIVRNGLEGLWISTHPLAYTDPPSPMLAMS